MSEPFALLQGWQENLKERHTLYIANYPLFYWLWSTKNKKYVKKTQANTDKLNKQGCGKVIITAKNHYIHRSMACFMLSISRFVMVQTPYNNPTWKHSSNNSLPLPLTL